MGQSPPKDICLENPQLRHSLNLALGALLLATPFITLHFWKLFSKAQESTSWPTTEGVVQRSEVPTMPIQKANSFRPLVEYVYAVNGRRYTNANIAPSGHDVGMSYEAAEKVTQKYPVGGKIAAVYYDPSEPSRSCLEPGAGFAHYLLAFIIPIVLMAIPIAWFRYEYRWLRSRW